MILLACPGTGALEGVAASADLLELFEGADRGWFVAEPIPRGWDIQRKAPAGFRPAANAA